MLQMAKQFPLIDQFNKYNNFISNQKRKISLYVGFLSNTIILTEAIFR